MKIKLYFFGKKNEITDFETEMSRRINFRTKFELIPLPQAGLTDGNAAKKQEAEKFWSKFSANFLIAFDEHGQQKNSVNFAQYLKKTLDEKKEVAFVIGGAYGLDKSITEKADLVLSCGDMIWTRNLFRQMACEQIYRALEIEGGSNFHKA